LEWGSFDRSKEHSRVVLGSDVDGREGDRDDVEIANAPASDGLPSVKPKAVVVIRLYTYDCACIETNTTIKP
jgi:hypothetical protein